MSSKVIIDGGSCQNVVTEIAVLRLKLKAVPHPDPYSVAWVNKTTIPVTHKCLVPIHIEGYEESVLCDVLPIDVAHILFGRPWIYDHSVTHYGRQNTYVFMHNGHKITFCPSRPREISISEVKVNSVPTRLTKPLHVLKMSEFERCALDSKLL